MPNSQIKIEIEGEAFNQIHNALVEYGVYEIGGMLIGYQKGRNHFAISNATVADDFGTFNIASFIREPLKSMKTLVRMFERKRHNYIGEWHSHPKFSLFPSDYDVRTMKGILNDPSYGVNFVILIIAKLNNNHTDIGAFLFHKELEHFIQARVNSFQGLSQKTIDISV